MKVSKWVDFGQEVEVEVSMEDIRAAMGESFCEVIDDRLGEPGPTAFDVKGALSDIAAFFRALTDEHIALLSDAQRKVVREFLERTAERFKPQECAVGKD